MTGPPHCAPPSPLVRHTSPRLSAAVRCAGRAEVKKAAKRGAKRRKRRDEKAEETRGERLATNVEQGSGKQQEEKREVCGGQCCVANLRAVAAQIGKQAPARKTKKELERCNDERSSRGAFGQASSGTADGTTRKSLCSARNMRGGGSDETSPFRPGPRPAGGKAEVRKPRYSSKKNPCARADLRGSRQDNCVARVLDAAKEAGRGRCRKSSEASSPETKMKAKRNDQARHRPYTAGARRRMRYTGFAVGVLSGRSRHCVEVG